MRDTDKILGLAPKDYAVLKNLDLIDLTNKVHEEMDDKQTISPRSTCFDGQSKKMSSDDIVMKWFDKIVKRSIVSHKSRLYQIQQLFILLLCVFSSYFYGLMAMFGETMLYEEIRNQYWVCEGVFLMDILLTFFIDFKDPIDGNLVRSHKKIFMNYLNGKFWRDFIPILPLQLIPLPLDTSHHLFIFKCFRIFKGLRVVDSRYVMKPVKGYFKRRLTKLEQNEPEIADDLTLDNTKMIYIIYI